MCDTQADDLLSVSDIEEIEVTPELDNREEEDKDAETSPAFAEPQQPCLGYEPVSTSIKRKLDEILENQRALFSLMSKLLGQEFDQGRADSFSPGRVEISDQGRAQVLGQEVAGSTPIYFPERVQILGRSLVCDQEVAQRAPVYSPVFDKQTAGRGQILSPKGTPVPVLESRHSNEFEGNCSEAWEGDDRFLAKVIKIKGESCSVGNFASKLVQAIFSPEELVERNCSGRKGKEALDEIKLEQVKKYVFRMYPTSHKEAQWKRCVIAIDEYLRRRSRTNASERKE